MNQAVVLMDVQIESHIYYIQFINVDYANCIYVIQNKLDLVEFVAFQDKTDSEKGFVFKNKETQIIGWDKPLLPKTLRINLACKNQIADLQSSLQITLNFEDYNYCKEFMIADLAFFVKMKINGQRRKLVFERESDLRKKDGKQTLQVELKLSQIGVSFIGTYHKNRLEMLYLSLRNLDFLMIQTFDKNVFQLRIQLINVDNNTYLNDNLPILFTQFDRADSSHHLNICMEQVRSLSQDTLIRNLFFVKQLIVSVKKSVFNLDYDLLTILAKFFKDISQLKFIKNRASSWQDHQSHFVKNDVFIEDLIISPIHVNFTFKAQY